MSNIQTSTNTFSHINPTPRVFKLQPTRAALTTVVPSVYYRFGKGLALNGQRVPFLSDLNSLNLSLRLYHWFVKTCASCIQNKLMVCSWTWMWSQLFLKAFILTNCFLKCIVSLHILSIWFYTYCRTNTLIKGTTKFDSGSQTETRYKTRFNNV